MDQNLSENDRTALYQEQRDRTPTPLKKKHLRQFDQEFALLTQSNPAMRVRCGISDSVISAWATVALPCGS